VGTRVHEEDRSDADEANEADEIASTGQERGSLWQIIMLFGRIGLTSFGGGLSAWIYLESVERRRWLKDDEFFAGLALAQILPGPNVINLSIFIGHRQRGIAGGIAAVLSLLLPPMAVVIGLAMLVHRYGINSTMESVLQGIAAGAIGTTICVGFRSLRNATRVHRWPLLIAALTFVSIGFFHVSLINTVLALLPVSFALSWNIDKDG
jgi:chromate transporter